MKLTEKEFAAAKLAAMLIEIFGDDRAWTCRLCGGHTAIMCEVCDQCGVEDINQGDLRYELNQAWWE